MANDRIWIVCTVCGERTLLAKHYPGVKLGELYQSAYKLDKWISKHLNHHPMQNAGDLNNDPGLMFRTDY